MKKKIIENLTNQLESAYNDKFVVGDIIALRTRTKKYLMSFSCERAASIGVIVSSNLFGTKIIEIKDNYMIRTRSQEIISRIEEIIEPFFECDYKVVLIPGSDVPLGTYNNMTHIDKIITGLDEYDEFIILSKDEITQEIAERIRYEFECRKFSFSAYLLGQVEPGLYDRIEEAYFDNNEIEGVSTNCRTLFHEEQGYIIEG